MVSEDEEIFLSSLQPDGVLPTSVKPGQKFHSNLLQSKLLDGVGLMPQTPQEQFCSISVYKLVVAHSSALPICREHWRRKPLQRAEDPSNLSGSLCCWAGRRTGNWWWFWRIHRGWGRGKHSDVASSYSCANWLWECVPDQIPLWGALLHLLHSYLR